MGSGGFLTEVEKLILNLIASVSVVGDNTHLCYSYIINTK